MHNGFHPKNNIDQLFLLRSESSRRLIGVQDNAETAILGLRNYVRNSKERLLSAACTIENNKNKEKSNEYKMRKKNERKTQWTQQQLCGPFIRQTTSKASEDR